MWTGTLISGILKVRYLSDYCTEEMVMDVLTPEQRKKNMKNIRSKDTKIEVILRKDPGERVSVTVKIMISFQEIRILS